jgi:hypothetical protein
VTRGEGDALDVTIVGIGIVRHAEHWKVGTIRSACTPRRYGGVRSVAAVFR